MLQKLMVIMAAIFMLAGCMEDRVIWNDNGKLDQSTENRKVWDSNGKMGTEDRKVWNDSDGEPVVE
jgi:uncharacterized lipoprotein YajG